MAEVRKAAHGEVVNNLQEVIDAQIADWPRDHGPFGWVPKAADQTQRQRQLAQGTPPNEVRPEVARLLVAEPPPLGELRSIFADFMEHANWQCETCGNALDGSTLKVPPPVLNKGKPEFHMYCSEHA